MSSADPNPEDQAETGQNAFREIAILPLRNLVIFPTRVIPISVGQIRSLRLVEDAVNSGQIIGILAMRTPSEKDPDPENLFRTGVLAKVMRVMRAPDGSTHILVRGLEKMHVDRFITGEPYMRAMIHTVDEMVPPQGDIEAEALRMNLAESFRKLASITGLLPEEQLKSITETYDYRVFTYLVASNIRMDILLAQEVLELNRILVKMRRLLEIIRHDLGVLELGKKIQSEAKSEMDKAQRDFFLRQQLKAIQKELGEDGEGLKVDEYRKKIETLELPEEARQEAMRELGRMEKLPEASAEYGVILTYLDWITNLPWNQATKDNLDIDRAKKILDEDHYNLVKIKERILEYLAVRKLRMDRAAERAELEAAEASLAAAATPVLEDGETLEPLQPVNKVNETEPLLRREREGVILCFVGPPGLGKTSLGQSIARALGRKFHRVSLGGIRDEAEIRGHRRTYIGAMPGRFIQALRRAGTRNPVIMLDEVDKIGSDWRGDPSSALLEVLDPEQNREFRDHYLDVPFDLSQVMFIATANVLDTIPSPLRDRLEILTLSGYTDDEKLRIAQQYLLPRQIRENGLREGEVSLKDSAVLKVIREHTREAGVRALERKVGTLCRKIAVKIAKQELLSVQIDDANLIDYLGKPAFNYDEAERVETPGVATGLAVTSVGGDILFVEATKMQGKKGLTVTGQLGDVMKESVEAAVSYVRSQAANLNLEGDFFENMDLHVHIPAGATPKDGPSAGVTVVSALTSLLTGRPVRKDVGMTGEITLRGKVLPVGGIKDKILAAHRAGLKTVILPKRNEQDLDDLPDSVRAEMTFVLADHVSEVLASALVPL